VTVGSLKTMLAQLLLGEKDNVNVNNDANNGNIYHRYVLRQIAMVNRPRVSSLPRWFHGHSAVNTTDRDAVLPRAHAQLVSSDTVVKCFRQGRGFNKSNKLHARAKLK